MSIRKVLVSAAMAVVAGLSLAAGSPPPPPYVVTKTIPIGGEGRWDYASYDPDSKLLFVTRSTHTQAIDVRQGKAAYDVPDQQHAHGAIAVTASGRGFITDGGAGKIVVFDLKTGRVQGSITAASDADAISYDKATNLVVAGCGDAKKLAVVSPTIDLKDAKADLIDLPGSPEQVDCDGEGHAYANINDKNEVCAIDLKNKKITATWTIGDGAKPTGLAVDPAAHLLFVGCRNEKFIVMSSQDGKIVADVPLGKSNDFCAFNPETHEALASCGDGTVTVLTEKPDQKFDAVTITTKPAARTMALDAANKTLYLPTSELAEPATPGARPAMKPGGFMIVVVAPPEKK